MKVPDTIEVMVGQTVILSCKVANLEDRMVSEYIFSNGFSLRHSLLTVIYTLGTLTFHKLTIQWWDLKL